MIWQFPDGAGTLYPRWDRVLPAKQMPSWRRGLTALLITLSVALAVWIGIELHSPQAPLLWFALLIVWTWYFWPSGQKLSPSTRRWPFLHLLIVFVAAVFFRLYQIHELPVGPYVDEIFILRDSLELDHAPFDLFGQTPLFRPDLDKIPNLYLYFNLLILKLTGVSYFGMKMVSVVPGIITSVVFYLICRRLLRRGTALWAGLLFASAHWPVRMSRYGWFVSFMIMTFALSLWLLILACQTERNRWAWFSGITAGICLYSYTASRVCLASLLLFLILEWLIRRKRVHLRRLLVFIGGAITAALPLGFYYLYNLRDFVIRMRQLSILGEDNLMALIADSLWRHAAMFHIRGGLYARDNYPGLPMMGIICGILFLAGIVFLLRRIDTPVARLLFCTLFPNFAGGLFSISQEGAPYVLRVAAVMISAFLIAAVGLEWVVHLAVCRLNKRRLSRWLPALAVIPAIAINIYLYFGLEPNNLSAARVMGYEVRIIGREISKTDLPVYLVGQEVFARAEPDHFPGEKFADRNPEAEFTPALNISSMLFFSARYNAELTVADNLSQMRGISVIPTVSTDNFQMSFKTPAIIMFNARNQTILTWLKSRLPGAAIHYLPDILGRDLIGVAEIN